jgi:hypothetical protein
MSGLQTFVQVDTPERAIRPYLLIPDSPPIETS